MLQVLYFFTKAISLNQNPAGLQTALPSYPHNSKRTTDHLARWHVIDACVRESSWATAKRGIVSGLYPRQRLSLKIAGMSVLATILGATSLASAQKPPLMSLDGLLASAKTSTSQQSVEAAAKYLVDNLQGFPIQDLDRQKFTSSLIAAQTKYLDDPRTGVPEAALTSACNTWFVSAGATTAVGQTAADLHAYRIAMSEVAPHLFVRSTNGQVPSSMSPIEAFYILDICFAQGSFPGVTHSTGGINQDVIVQSLTQYAHHVDAYYAHTSPEERRLKLTTMLSAIALN